MRSVCIFSPALYLLTRYSSRTSLRSNVQLLLLGELCASRSITKDKTRSQKLLQGAPQNQIQGSPFHRPDLFHTGLRVYRSQCHHGSLLEKRTYSGRIAHRRQATIVVNSCVDLEADLSAFVLITFVILETLCWSTYYYQSLLRSRFPGQDEPWPDLGQRAHSCNALTEG